MPTPTIPDGELFFNATTYTGTGAALTITNGAAGQSFQPDFIWTKVRSASGQHVLNDSVRGADKTLYSSLTNAEQTNTAGTGITAFNSNGYTLGTQISGTGDTNGSGSTYVAWQWKAGGAAVTNTAGSVSAQVSANPSAGFSIATFTKNATNVTVGHGLGVAPAMIIVKGRGPSTSNWLVYHKNANASPQNGGLALEQTNAFSSNAGYWNNTSPTSSVFTVGSFMPNENSVAYCWSEIDGYSRFGSYTGNGSADGPFVFTGFEPRFVMVKRTNAVSNWHMIDTARSPFNVSNANLFANLSSAESVGASEDMDILSNGFKPRNASASFNISGSTYIYMAFAENPFKYANAR